MRIFRATLAFWCALSVNALAADDASAIRTKVEAAQKAVTSFQLQLSSPMGLTGVGTIVTHPQLSHIRVASGPVVVEIYTDEHAVYQKIGSGAWQKRTLPPSASQMTDMLGAFKDNTSVTLAPDVTENGVSYGAYAISVNTASIPGAPQVGPLTVTCTFDKVTSLPHTCTAPFMTETFSHYNDPANVVTLPPEVVNAPDAGPLLPAAGASPAPPPKP